MIDISEISPGSTFLLYDEEFDYLTAPKQVDILNYEDGYTNHTLYSYTEKTELNSCPVISPTKELSRRLFELDELVDLTALYYKVLISKENIEISKDDYLEFVALYPEKVL